MDPLLKDAYSATRFRESAHRVVDILADHLEASLAGKKPQALPWIEPEASLAYWQSVGEEGIELEDFCREVIDRSVQISDPKFMGHQICTPAPTAVIAGLITDCLNNGSGVYEMGMAGTAMERFVIQTVARQLGLSEQASGFMTSGGTLANLTAMLAARAVKSSREDWSQGTRGQLAIMVSDQSHYCIDRAVRIMGWGETGIIQVPSDDRFRMCTAALPELREQATRAGRQVIAVVGSAGSTSTGSFDDLREIGKFCREEGLWFHVDGAHGAAVAFSDRTRPLLSGIEHADSVVIDFHKMLMTPVLSSGLLFRNGEDSFRTFAVEAEYLFAGGAERDWFNLARRTFECTKTMMAAKVFSILAVHGTQLLRANVDRLHELCRRFAVLIRQRKHFEIATEPETNILCFRHTGQAGVPTDLNALNNHIRQRLTQAGRHYLVKTTLRGKIWLRTTISNPFTSETEMVDLLDAIELVAAESGAAMMS